MIGGWYEEDNAVIGSKYCIIYTTQAGQPLVSHSWLVLIYSHHDPLVHPS